MWETTLPVSIDDSTIPLSSQTLRSILSFNTTLLVVVERWLSKQPHTHRAEKKLIFPASIGPNCSGLYPIVMTLELKHTNNTDNGTGLSAGDAVKRGQDAK